MSKSKPQKPVRVVVVRANPKLRQELYEMVRIGRGSMNDGWLIFGQAFARGPGYDKGFDLRFCLINREQVEIIKRAMSRAGISRAKPNGASARRP